MFDLRFSSWGEKKKKEKKKKGKKSQTLEYILFGKTLLSTIFKRSLKQIQFSWKGNGREGDSSIVPLVHKTSGYSLHFCFCFAKSKRSLQPLEKLGSVLYEMLLSADHWNWLFMHHVVTRVQSKYWKGTPPHTLPKTMLWSHKLFVVIVV